MPFRADSSRIIALVARVTDRTAGLLVKFIARRKKKEKKKTIAHAFCS